MKLKDNKSIVLTGGGTAGHVIPNLEIAKYLEKQSWSIDYIGSNGIEKKLVNNTGIHFHEIKAGKLRRYWSLQNFIDVFKIFYGFIQSLFIIWRLSPSVIFSKGGFVSVPPCIAAWILRVPIYVHESDLTPGLANKIISKISTQSFFSFIQTKKFFHGSSMHVGALVKSNVYNAKPINGKAFLDFKDSSKKTILFMGGSLGSHKINLALHKSFDLLQKNFNIVHLTGQDKSIPIKSDSYKSFEYLDNELADVMSSVDLIVSRAGANSIFEFLELKKPMLLIPLEEGSRGDQLLNANAFFDCGWAHILREAELNSHTLLEAIKTVQDESSALIKNMNEYSSVNGVLTVVNYLNKVIS